MTIFIVALLLKNMSAAGLGFEPRFPRPERGVTTVALPGNKKVLRVFYNTLFPCIFPVLPQRDPAMAGPLILLPFREHPGFLFQRVCFP